MRSGPVFVLALFAQFEFRTCNAHLDDARKFVVHLTDDCVCVDHFHWNENENCSRNKNFTHFWKSTGLSPLEPKYEAHKFLLSPDEKFNLLFIATLPRDGIEQVRIHWMIYLISYENNEYNFTYLDQLLDLLHNNSLRPGFELMGLPLNVNPDEVKPKLYEFWYDLILTIVEHCIDRYDYEEVQEWRFELMNEPDLKQYNFLNFTVDEYLLYARACTNALRDATSAQRKLRERIVDGKYLLDVLPSISSISNSNNHQTKRSSKKIKNDLRLGGPAGLFKQRQRHPLCWGLMDYCNASVTTLTECNLQFITFHKKGNGTARQVLREDLQLIRELRQKYTFMRDLPIANDEADILTNWSLDEEWRGDVQYAALVAKVILDHYNVMVQAGNLKIEVLSNDNAFLNFHPHYFTQRTLLTRFQMNNTSPPHLQFIKKPVFTLMGMLSLLGSEYLPVNVTSHSNNVPREDEETEVKVIATRTTRKYINFLSFLIVTLNDNVNSTKYLQRVQLTLNNNSNSTSSLLSKGLMIVFMLDNVSTNPYKVWKQNGRPIFPHKYIRKKMRQFEGPARIGVFDLNELNDGNVIRCLKSELELTKTDHNQLVINLNVLNPSVHLINFCIDDEMNAPPGRPTHLRGYYVTTGEILLVWSDKKVRSRCVKTYEVEYQISSRDRFVRVNKEDSIFLSYQYDFLEDITFGDYGINSPAGYDYKNRFNDTAWNAWRREQHYKFYGRFRVRAVDFWNRPGKYSNIFDYNEIVYF